MNLAPLPLRAIATLVSWLLRAIAYVIALWIVEVEVSYGTSLTGRQILEVFVWTVVVAAFIMVDRWVENLHASGSLGLRVVLGVLVACAFVVAISTHETIGKDATYILRSSSLLWVPFGCPFSQIDSSFASWRPLPLYA